MVNKWILEERRDLFIRDLVEKFFEAKIFFDKIFQRYQKEGEISFKEMDYWVGTEIKKGTLWELKDECHALFRNNKSEVGLYEHFFDWTFGSIFHECMKLKEDIYQIESYKPVYLQFQKEKKTSIDFEVKKMLDKIHSVIDKVEKDLAEKMKGVSYLFSEAATQLRKLFPNFSQNGLLVRFLVENKKLVEQVFNKGSLKKILFSMYPKGIESAYLVVAKNYMKGCWYKEAADALKKVLEINPRNVEAKKELENTITRMSVQEG